MGPTTCFSDGRYVDARYAKMVWNARSAEATTCYRWAAVPRSKRARTAAVDLQAGRDDKFHNRSTPFDVACTQQLADSVPGTRSPGVCPRIYIVQQ